MTLLTETTTHECRACRRIFPANVEYFYVAGGHFNWICKPCMISYVGAYKRERHGRLGLHTVECEYCGKQWESWQRSARLCSYECRHRWRNERAKAARLAAKVAEASMCLHCGEPISARTRIDAAFCSERCNAAAHQLVRKMAGRAGAERRWVFRAEIAQRDGWRCGLCHGKVDRRKTHPDPKAPSIDHIVPLARGGTNEMTNLQLTHLRCNLSKRADARNEQLRLLG